MHEHSIAPVDIPCISIRLTHSDLHLLSRLCPVTHQVDFLSETDHFIHALKEGLKSLVGGLELRGMDSTTRESSEGLDTRNFTQVHAANGKRSAIKSTNGRFVWWQPKPCYFSCSAMIVVSYRVDLDTAPK